MLRIIQIIFLVLLVQLLCCCSPSTIIVDNETVLDDDARIEWVITKADTLIDFRNGIDGFAKVGNNKISFRTSIDSVKKYELTEFRRIHVGSETNHARYLIAGGLAVIGATLYIIGMGSGPGG